MRKLWKKVLVGACCVMLMGSFAACGKGADSPAEVTKAPETTKEPEATKRPEATKAPEATKRPEATKAPEATRAPVVTEAPEVTAVPEVVSLKDAAEGCGFSFGTVISAYSKYDLSYKMMLMDEFNSVTAANEMKAYSMLDQNASQWSEDGMPVINFSQADEIVSLAELLGIGVRGHVLVWDAYMCDWFFREEYKSNTPYVDEATMKARLKFYIEKVITHFETEFPGVVYCWDVVNEAVGDSASDYDDSDGRHIRTERSGVENQFYNIIGSDYVELSFVYAKDTVEKLQKQNPDVNIALFYNDYNTFIPEKRDAICEVIESINSYAKDKNGNYRKLCDGVGMQSYIGGYGYQTGCMNPVDIEWIQTAIEKFHALGVEIHVTELAVRNYDETLMAEHAEFYGQLFDMDVEVNKEEPVVTNISIWGITDAPWMDESNGNYKQNSPYCGLFDENYKRKDAYYKVIDAMEQAEE